MRLAEAVGLESARALRRSSTPCCSRTPAARRTRRRSPRSSAATTSRSSASAGRSTRTAPRTTLGHRGATSPPAPPLRAARQSSARRRGDERRRRATSSSLRCERGADIARMIGLDETPPPRSATSTSTGTAAATPPASRARRSRCRGASSCLAQTMEVFWQQGGAAAACDVARAPARHLVRPALVDAAGRARARRRLLGLARGARRQRRRARRPRAASPTTRAWTASPRPSRGIVDAKSPYTAPPLARASPRSPSASPRRSASTPRPGALLRRAGAAARPRQARRLQPHPRQARQARPPTSGRVVRAPPARSSTRDPARACRRSPTSRGSPATHHERLDGSGYPCGLTAGELEPPRPHPAGRRRADALSAERPYRGRCRPTRCWRSCATTPASASTPAPSQPSSRGCPSRPSRLTSVA